MQQLCQQGLSPLALAVAFPLLAAIIALELDKTRIGQQYVTFSSSAIIALLAMH